MGSNLKSTRLQKGFSVEEIAKLADVKAQTYYKYEAGTRFPSRKVMLRLSSVLDASVESLFFANMIDHKSNLATRTKRKKGA